MTTEPTWIDPYQMDPKAALAEIPASGAKAALGIFLAGKAHRGAVLVCPGGGYGGLADHEGPTIARWLNKLGIHAFVLRYRHAPHHRHPAPVSDAKRAMRLIRFGAAQGWWPVVADKVAVMGFSAGGHLSATLATEPDEVSKKPSSDPVEALPFRPNGQILCYPVITLSRANAHVGSRKNLLGEGSFWPMAASLDADCRVTKDAPPAFLFHTADDPAVPVTNSLDYAAALARHGINAEVHIFPHGRHGVGLAADEPVLKLWPELLAGWLKGREW